MVRVYVLFILLCLVTFSHAQENNSFVTISGVLQDSATQEPLMSASVILLNPADSTMASFSLTNADGLFKLRRVAPGTYVRQISYVGYGVQSESVTITGEQKEKDVGIISIASLPELLDGAVITDERVAIRVSKDTLIYNADAFKTQPNDNVEELLKKMPGIEVDSDGTITAEGEEVEKVYVDGKEFFGSDPKVATKNLPARAIKEVQVFDKKSDMAEFSGVDDGLRSKTINLKLKEDFKKGAFGSVTGGYGTDERYEGKFNLNSFSKKNQVSFIGQLNNINEQGFSFNEYINFMGGMSNLMRGGRVRMGSGSSAIPISQGLSDGNTETGGIGFNFNRDFSKKTRLNVNYFYSQLDNLIIENRNINFFQNRGAFTTTELESQNSKNNNHRMAARLDHEIDSTQSVRLTLSGSLNDVNYNTTLDGESLNRIGDLQNTNDVLNTADGNNQSVNAEALYRKKLKKKGRSFVTTLGYSRAPADQEIDLLSTNQFFERDSIRLINLNQFQAEDQIEQEIKTSSTWTEPLGKRTFLGITYTYTQNNNDSDKSVFDIDENSSKIKNSLLSNNYDQVTRVHLGELGLRWILNSSNINFGLGLQHTDLNGDIEGQILPIQKLSTHVLPNLNWNYDFSRSKSVSVNYRTNIQQPTLRQLQPIIENSDPTNIYVGNPNLVPEYNHSIRLRFRNFSQFNNTGLFGNVNLTFTKNQITNATSIDQALVRTVTPVNVDNFFRSNAWLSYNMPLRFMKSRLKMGTNGSYSDGQTIINDLMNDTERLNGRLTVSLDNQKKEFIDWAVGAEFGASKTTYSTDQSDQKFSNQTYWAELTKVLGSWTIRSSFDIDIYNDNFSSSSQSIPLWNASISKFILNNKFELKLSAFDLLDQNTGYSQQLQTNFLEETISNTIGQYFMFSATYTIGNFKNNSFQMTGPRRRR